VFGIRIRAHGPAGGQVPPGAAARPGSDIGPALIPVPAVFAAAWQSNGMIHGAAGTQRVAAPAPFAGLDFSPVAVASTGKIGLPSSAVPYWYPQLWWQTDIPAVIPVQTINSTHMFPAPAIRPNNIMAMRGTNEPGGISPADGSFRARYGGGWPIGWPRVIANYPT
jgi:hypothetical protein